MEPIMTFRAISSILSAVIIFMLPTLGFTEDTTTTTSSPTPTTTESTPTATTPATPAATDSSTTTTTTNAAPTFQSTCVNAWMGRNTDVTDKMDFKNFGEKYCKCAETQQPLDSQEAVNKAAQVCMSRTLLQDAMDNVEEKVGLDKVTSQDIENACQDRWHLVYPKMDDNDKKIASSYCSCANSKLADLSKRAANMTDDEYYKEINGIAATCSGKEGK